MTNKSRKLNESDHPHVLEATGSDKEIGKKPRARSKNKRKRAGNMDSGNGTE